MNVSIACHLWNVHRNVKVSRTANAYLYFIISYFTQRRICYTRTHIGCPLYMCVRAKLLFTFNYFAWRTYNFSACSISNRVAYGMAFCNSYYLVKCGCVLKFHLIGTIPGNFNGYCCSRICFVHY